MKGNIVSEIRNEHQEDKLRGVSGKIHEGKRQVREKEHLSTVVHAKCV